MFLQKKIIENNFSQQNGQAHNIENCQASTG